MASSVRRVHKSLPSRIHRTLTSLPWLLWTTPSSSSLLVVYVLLVFLVSLCIFRPARIMGYSCYCDTSSFFFPVNYESRVGWTKRVTCASFRTDVWSCWLSLFLNQIISRPKLLPLLVPLCLAHMMTSILGVAPTNLFVLAVASSH